MMAIRLMAGRLEFVLVAAAILAVQDGFLVVRGAGVGCCCQF